MLLNKIYTLGVPTFTNFTSMKIKKSLYTLFTFFLILSACQNPTAPPAEGFIPVKGGKIWYKVLGNGPGTPLIVVHGGPGSRSCGGIDAYELMGDERPVVLFDQLESGNSDRPNDTTLWKLPYFVDQVQAVVDHLGYEKFHLLGSSWGGAIVTEYMLTQNTDHVSSLILAGPLVSTPLWIKDAKILVSQLSQPVQDTIKKYEQLGEYTNANYLAATDTFYANFLSRKQWPPQPDPNCDTVPGFNTKIYNYMWGPTEFTATGTLKNFDRLDQLSEIEKPTLVIVGDHDEVRVETAEFIQSKIKGAELAIVPHSGHGKTTDNPESYTQQIGEFLNKVEGKQN